MTREEPDTTGAQAGSRDHRRRRAVAAGALLVAAGLLDILAGFETIPVDRYFDVDVAGTHHLDITGWGWLHLGIGVVVALGGLAAVAADRHWTAVLAVAGAAASIGVNLLLFPYHPLLGVMVVALDLVAIPLLARNMRAGRRDDPVGAHRR
ncbi:DUF7144 family membrane protein [Micromonospora zhanjiangensis]|uniref:DUF7144 domain-containing protein n=1 Tax=Micromonospora zhanjiangensis TaxID=1522057 RepID=A0ABV8KK21_9ACTN